MLCLQVFILSFLISTLHGADSRKSLFQDRIPRQLQAELIKKEGVSKSNGLGIIGGHDSEKGKLNWQVSLRIHATKPKEFEAHFCGGSVIDEEWVLTAAHCLDVDFNEMFETDEFEIFVVAGDYKLSDLDGDEQARKVNKSFIHPDYNINKRLGNDIALIKVSEKFEFNKYVANIDLPSAEDNFDGEECIVSGWGDIDIDLEEVELPDILQEVTVTVITDEKCESSCEDAMESQEVEYDCDILETAMCAGTTGGGKDACQGDSGGPLACERNHTIYQPGVVSYGVGCGLPDLYGVYTETSYYLDWIEKIMETEENDDDDDDDDDDDTGAANASFISIILTFVCYLSTVLFK